MSRQPTSTTAAYPVREVSDVARQGGTVGSVTRREAGTSCGATRGASSNGVTGGGTSTWCSRGNALGQAARHQILRHGRHLQTRNEDDPYYGVYRFKIGFGGEVTDFLGCLDLPIKNTRAEAWYRFEPEYYRLYYKLKDNVFY